MAAKKAIKKTSKPSKTEQRRPAAPSRQPSKKTAKSAAKGRKPSSKSRKTVKARGARRAAQLTTVVQFQYVRHVKRLPGASAAQLAAIERHFGGALPTDYAEFLRGVNGGCPAPSYVPGKPFGFGIEAFYGAGAASDYYDVLQTSQQTSASAGRTLVAIAGDGSGDQLVLVVPGDPAIYWWSHDDDDEPRRVAKSFDALLASLTAPKD